MGSHDVGVAVEELKMEQLWCRKGDRAQGDRVRVRVRVRVNDRIRVWVEIALTRL